MNNIVGSFAPVIILLSDGGPTDDYGKELNALKGNNWFKAAIKIAIAIGEDANQEVLKEFTGNDECVLRANNLSILKKMIRFVDISNWQIDNEGSNAGEEEWEKSEPTGDYKKELDALKSNDWFKADIKINSARCEDANLEIRKEFTGYIECVLKANNPSVLKKMIRFVDITVQEFLDEDVPTIRNTKGSSGINVSEW
jgi:hypothetical protein